MRYTREALALASLVQGILINALLFKVGFWMPETIWQTIGIWAICTGVLTYCIYRALLAIARGNIVTEE